MRTLPAVVDYEARIAHPYLQRLQYSASEPARRGRIRISFLTPVTTFITKASEDSYRDFFFNVYNSDQDSNETGAPIIRSKLFLSGRWQP